MIKVLFVCHGNICRSPMAEFVFKDMVNRRGLSGNFEIASAATSCEEIGNDIHQGTRQKLIDENIPFSPRAARRINAHDFEYYDYILCMDTNNLRNLPAAEKKKYSGKIFRLLDFGTASRDIADPWYTGNFDDTYRDICKGCNDFLKSLADNGKL